MAYRNSRRRGGRRQSRKIPYYLIQRGGVRL